MYRLGLRLTLQGGKEALIRLGLTMIAVAIGVVVLLAVIAGFHAFEVTSGRPSWESTVGTQISGPLAKQPNTLLWNYSENVFKGQFIEQLDVAALGSNAPVLPGVSKLPGPGQYYASPALSKMLTSVPHDELGARFAGSEGGTIGQAALSGPNELVVYVGYTPSALASLRSTVEVTKIATSAQTEGTTSIYRLAFGIGAIALLFPILILIGTATRLSAARREERYAAMRLVGATPHQINIIASVDAIVGALFGTILGILIFLPVRPSLAKMSLSGVQYFSNYVTPTILGYVGMLLVVPTAAALASLASLHSVRISPLGVSRKVRSKAPTAWRLIPLLAGIPIFVFPILNNAKSVASARTGIGSKIAPEFIGFGLILVGLIVGGPWLTMRAARLLARIGRGPSVLLAARRLEDNPKAAFRTVSGLVLAVFVGTVIAVVAPAFNAAQSPTGDSSLSNVLRASYSFGPTGGLPRATEVSLVSKLQSIAGVIVIPIYANPSFVAFQAAYASPPNPKNPGGPMQTSNTPPPDDSIVVCASLKQLNVLGECARGATLVQANMGQVLQTDNPLDVYSSLPLVNQDSPTANASSSSLPLSAILVKSSNSDSLEKARTFLTTFNTTASPGDQNGLAGWQMETLEPETFGEVASIRNNDDNNLEKVILAAVILTIFVASCSLAVTVGGGLVERRRPFTLLRLGGTPISTLYKVVLMESVLPLVTASLVAAAVGFGVARPVITSLLLAQTGIHVTAYPGSSYYGAMAFGLGISMIVIMAMLPLLGHITKPDDARFE